jgi:phospholipase/lecithinase/hemolysin
MPTYLSLVFCLLNVALCSHAIEAGRVLYDTLVIFGDSNSDNGNVYNKSGGIFPPPPYFRGRFSNDIVWAERVNVSQMVNHAHGGATTDNDLLQGYAYNQIIPVPGVRQQLASYSQSIQSNRPNFNRTLYVIWAGANNYLRNRTASLLLVSESISQLTAELIRLGGKHIVIVNQPPFQLIPLFQPLLTSGNTTDVAHQYNRNLSASIAALQNQYTDKDLHVFDLHALVSKVLANGSLYGMGNTVDSCWRFSRNNVTVCSNPSSYAFFDEVHFSSRMHQIVADEFSKFLTSSCERHFVPSLLLIAVLLPALALILFG